MGGVLGCDDLEHPYRKEVANPFDAGQGANSDVGRRQEVHWSSSVVEWADSRPTLAFHLSRSGHLSAREPHVRLTLLCTVCAVAGAAAVLFGRRSWRRFLWWLFSRGDA